jgi:hypothetical protein
MELYLDCNGFNVDSCKICFSGPLNQLSLFYGVSVRCLVLPRTHSVQISHGFDLRSTLHYWRRRAYPLLARDTERSNEVLSFQEIPDFDLCKVN